MRFAKSRLQKYGDGKRLKQKGFLVQQRSHQQRFFFCPEEYYRKLKQTFEGKFENELKRLGIQVEKTKLKLFFVVFVRITLTI